MSQLTSPAPPVFPAPVLPWSVSFGGVKAKPCAATFIGLIHPGVIQVNACVPGGVPQTRNLEVAVSVGGGDGGRLIRPPGVALGSVNK
jgi:uncharacterized protein (TIGR03437 family)